MDAAAVDARRDVLLQYAARLPPRAPSFHWPRPPARLLAVQADLAAEYPQLLRPAAPAYERAFLRHLIDALTDAIAHAHDPDGELEIDERILQRYSDCLASSAAHTGPPPPSTIQYFYAPPPAPAQRQHDSSSSNGERPGPLHGLRSVTLHEEGTMISRGTTGLKTWEASLALAAHILHGAGATTAHIDPGPSIPSTTLWHDLVRPGARVLELGSGVGMLGVLCAQLQQSANQGRAGATAAQEDDDDDDDAAHVFMTDVPGQVLDALQGTVEQNGLATCTHVHLAPLDWLELAHEAERTAADAHTPRPLHHWLDTVAPTTLLAADVVFDPSLCPALARSIRAALAAGSVRRRGGGGEQPPLAYVASTVRNPTTYDVFLEALRGNGLEFERVPLPPSRPPMRLPAPPAAEPPPTPPSSSSSIPLFPSAHEPARDGTVELLRIRLAHVGALSTGAVSDA